MKIKINIKKIFNYLTPAAAAASAIFLFMFFVFTMYNLSTLKNSDDELTSNSKTTNSDIVESFKIKLTSNSSVEIKNDIFNIGLSLTTKSIDSPSAKAALSKKIDEIMKLSKANKTSLRKGEINTYFIPESTLLINDKDKHGGFFYAEVLMAINGSVDKVNIESLILKIQKINIKVTDINTYVSIMKLKDTKKALRRDALNKLNEKAEIRSNILGFTFHGFENLFVKYSDGNVRQKIFSNKDGYEGIGSRRKVFIISDNETTHLQVNINSNAVMRKD